MRSSTTTFPALSTNRLELRAPVTDDAGVFREIVSIPAVTRFSNWPDGPTKAQVERSIKWMAKIYASGKGCAWVIEDRQCKSLIGAIRFNSFDAKWKCGEIGYELHPDFWGKGLMTEAVAAVTTCGHQIFRLNRIEAWTLPGNTASDRVLEKAGFRYEGTLRQKARFKGAYHDFRMFGRIAQDPLQ
ncbi:MAG: GNAT family N-acetyltransferase [Rhizobiaceae bacterium]|nr:GNAT family N-acetyltransferase [Rhizobiaceae bacterium]